jgi:hypothetical protein
MAVPKQKQSLEDMLLEMNSIMLYSRETKDYVGRAKALLKFVGLYQGLKEYGHPDAHKYLSWYDKTFLHDLGISTRSSTGTNGVPYARP